ncbi:MAG: hypothetical protein A6F70_02480 [Cycloclasticus sp. symbiont of Bathymodiolus heckerae]|nr:MAG: hypothetical protein A6F70_02480 [Cycloclasticus sp. symbiont of Bathymodiolus heckerae]
MAQLRPSVLYTLLIVGGILTGVGMIYGLFYDSEKMKSNRYENSYAEFSGAVLTDKQETALGLLKSQDVEWAHFRFIEAIKSDNMEQVGAFIDAGMPLNSNSILLEIALGKSAHKKRMLSLLNNHYHLDLYALYKLPNFVSKFDQQLAEISGPYIEQRKEDYRVALIVYKKEFVAWEQKLEAKKREMLSVCENDACRSGRINDVRRLFADSEPQEPRKDYIVKERVNVSLLTVFAWQKDQALLQFLQQQGAELIPNKLFLTDAKLIYFTVDAMGKSTVLVSR